MELCESSKMTLGQWLDRWLDEYASVRLRDSTMSGYRMYAEQYIKPTNASFTLNTYTYVTGDMQKQASAIVGNFMEDIFGKELKPWQSKENGETEASI